MVVHRLGHLVVDGEERVERRHRILEDGRDPPPADPAHLGLAHLHQILASSSMLPPTIWALGGSRRTIEWQVVVLPQPDSPTSPKVSPASTEKLMPSTAFTTRVPR